LLVSEMAARELAIPAEAMRILVELGRIRPSIHTGSITDAFMVNEDEIPTDIFDDASIARQVIAACGVKVPDVLYLPTYLLRLSGSIVTNSYQTLEGDDAQLFYSNGLPVIQNYGEASDLIGNANFSTEEIERYQRTQIHELFEFKNLPDHKPFQLPQKADPAAEAMVELGNQFFKEKGAIPIGPALLRKYMIQRANDPWEVIDQYNGDRKKILIEGIPISYESFIKRFKQYLEDNGK